MAGAAGLAAGASAVADARLGVLPAPVRDEPPAAPLTARLQVLAAPTAAAKLAQAPTASPAAPLTQLATAPAPTRTKAQPRRRPARLTRMQLTRRARPRLNQRPLRQRRLPRLMRIFRRGSACAMKCLWQPDGRHWRAGLAGRRGPVSAGADLALAVCPRLRYVSEGELNANGLKPLRFDAYRGDTRREHAELTGRPASCAMATATSSAPSCAGAQDILSLVFQLALRAGALEGQTVQMTSGKRCTASRCASTAKASKTWPAKPWRWCRSAARRAGQRTEVWLAREQHNLPLRIRNSGENKLIDQRVIRVQVDGETILERPEPERIHHGH